MNIYSAPMEGLTGYIYRNVHRAHFGGVDKYFTPFLSPNQNHSFTSREANDVAPEHNQGIAVVPQILTNRAEDFIWAARELEARGYREVNLNLGCPSGTVVAKHKGAGFLALPGELDRFLDEIFREVQIDISIKTRIGLESPEEFPALLEIFNRYPARELIVHPRVRTDFYRNRPNRAAFARAVLESRSPVCYNGDIFTVRDSREFTEHFPDTERLMLGRGLVANPALAELVKAAGAPPDSPLTSARLAAFHQDLLEGYRKTISGDKNVLFKMKELWSCMIWMFPEGERWGKKIKKAQRMGEYEAAVSSLFNEQEPSGYTP